MIHRAMEAHPDTPTFEPRLPPRCAHCGYDLTGFSIGGTCPECGQRITPQQDPDLSSPAGSSLFCGVLALLALFACFLADDTLTALLMVFASFGLSCVGVVLAVLARRSIKRWPVRYAPGSMTIARLGFWLSAPGMILLLVGVGIELLRHAL